MNIKNRIRKVETNSAQNFDDWLASLSDEKLERFIVEYGGDKDGFAEWLKTLTEDEVKTIRYDKPGANALRGKFDEHQKQNQKN